MEVLPTFTGRFAEARGEGAKSAAAVDGLAGSARVYMSALRPA